MHIDESMAKRVPDGLCLGSAIEPAATKVPARRHIKPSPALSIIGKAPQTLKGRVIGMLVSDGADPSLIETLRAAVKKQGASVKIIAPQVGGARTCDGKLLQADQQLAGAPSVFFDAVAVIASEAGARELVREAAAVGFLSDAFNHLKVIGLFPLPNRCFSERVLLKSRWMAASWLSPAPMRLLGSLTSPRRGASGTASPSYVIFRNVYWGAASALAARQTGSGAGGTLFLGSALYLTWGSSVPLVRAVVSSTPVGSPPIELLIEAPYFAKLELNN